jgi:hypothetical protein
LPVHTCTDDDPGMPGLDTLFDLLQLAIKERTQLALENIALVLSGNSAAARSPEIAGIFRELRCADAR